VVSDYGVSHCSLFSTSRETSSWVDLLKLISSFEKKEVTQWMKIVTAQLRSTKSAVVGRRETIVRETTLVCCCVYL
jgi:hypothetical protein